MGYTHYWYRAPGAIDPPAWAKFLADCRKVCEAIVVPLGDASGENEAEFSAELIAFNGHCNSGQMMPQVARVDGLKWPEPKAEGVAGWSTAESPQSSSWFVSTRTLPDSGDGSYESFIIEREPKRCFDCCKTNFHPYDLAVQCCLIALKEHFGASAAITSDGDRDAWHEAADVCQHVLGYGLTFDLDESAVGDALEKVWEAGAKIAEELERVRKFGNYPPEPKDRDEAIERIRKALRERTGRPWSVTGGRGTAWGWIKINAPPKRRKWVYRESGTKSDGRPDYVLVYDESAEYGYMSHADAETLRKALGESSDIHCQGVSIPASSGHRTEYVDRAEGREPRTHGERYWD